MKPFAGESPLRGAPRLFCFHRGGEELSGYPLTCPHCGGVVKTYRNPFPTVDLILMDAAGEGVYLIERKNEPHGWALPGGFVDYGESLEDAARREGEEETNLRIELLGQVGAYGNPGRDPRFHTITVVYAAVGKGEARAKDDARAIRFHRWESLPDEMAFDHRGILDDYLRTGQKKK